MESDDVPTTVAHLTELLCTKNVESGELRRKLCKAKERLESSATGWSMPQTLSPVQTLPVPRLELFYEKHPDHGWTNTKVTYRLVYQAYWGDVIGIVFSVTRQQGGYRDSPFRYQADPSTPPKFDLPFRDGMHILWDAHHLRLPAFAVCGDHVEDLIPKIAEMISFWEKNAPVPFKPTP